MLLQASALVMSQTDCCSRSNSCCISVSDSGGLSDPRLRVPRYAMAAKSKEQWCYGSDDNKPNGNGIREIGGCNEEVECRIGGHESAGNCPLDLSVPRRGFIRSLSRSSIIITLRCLALAPFSVSCYLSTPLPLSWVARLLGGRGCTVVASLCVGVSQTIVFGNRGIYRSSVLCAYCYLLLSSSLPVCDCNRGWMFVGNGSLVDELL
jgi:hypothetical protein